MKKGKRRIAAAVCAALLWGLLAGCGGDTAPAQTGETVLVVDSCGREVEIPADVEAVVPSGSLAQMLLLTLCPEKLVGLSANLSRTQKKYISAQCQDLPVLGSFYSGGSTMNFEQVIGCRPQLIIDFGEDKLTIVEDMAAIEEKTNVPAIFVQGDIRSMAQAYRQLGQILGVEERGNALADYIDGVLADVEEKAASIPEEERRTVMYGEGAYGLDAKSADSIHAEIIELVGAVNVAQTYTDGGVSIEQVLLWDPDVIILSPDANYDEIFDDPVWAAARAVQQGEVYEIPYGPYNWIDKPPSVQRILGLQWLAQLLYPQVYDYDMAEAAQEYFRLFYNYEMTREEAVALMGNSLYR